MNNDGEGGIAERVKRQRRTGGSKNDDDVRRDSKSCDGSTLLESSVGQAVGTAAAIGEEERTSSKLQETELSRLSSDEVQKNLSFDDFLSHYHAANVDALEQLKEECDRARAPSPFPVFRTSEDLKSAQQSKAPILGSVQESTLEAAESAGGVYLRKRIKAVPEGIAVAREIAAGTLRPEELAAKIEAIQKEKGALEKVIKEKKAATLAQAQAQANICKPILAPKNAMPTLDPAHSSKLSSVSSQMSSQSERDTLGRDANFGNSGKGEKRGKYRCGFCGNLKENHICEAVAVRGIDEGAQTDICSNADAGQQDGKISLGSGVRVIAVSTPTCTDTVDQEKRRSEDKEEERSFGSTT